MSTAPTCLAPTWPSWIAPRTNAARSADTPTILLGSIQRWQVSRRNIAPSSQGCHYFPRTGITGVTSDIIKTNGPMTLPIFFDYRPYAIMSYRRRGSNVHRKFSQPSDKLLLWRRSVQRRKNLALSFRDNNVGGCCHSNLEYHLVVGGRF